jgi:putative endonuclease
MPYMYILECADGMYYTGSTKNLQIRMEQHYEGVGCEYTKTRMPVHLVFVEEYENIYEAFSRERQIHGWSHRKKKALIEGNTFDLIEFSRSSSKDK